MFLQFMASSAGRWIRVVAGNLLILVGALIGGAGWWLAVVGLVPPLAGALDVCVVAPLFHQPFKVSDLRRAGVR